MAIAIGGKAGVNRRELFQRGGAAEECQPVEGDVHVRLLDSLGQAGTVDEVLAVRQHVRRRGGRLAPGPQKQVEDAKRSSAWLTTRRRVLFRSRRAQGAPRASVAHNCSATHCDAQQPGTEVSASGSSRRVMLE